MNLWHFDVQLAFEFFLYSKAGGPLADVILNHTLN